MNTATAKPITAKFSGEVGLGGQREFAALADDRTQGSYSSFPLHPG